MHRRVLVTGGSGFIGRHCLAPLLRRGYEVHALASSGPCPLPDQVRWHRLDLLDAAARRFLVTELEPTDLLHLAWHRGMTGPSFEWLRAGIELLSAFHDAGGRRVVVSGTCAEYDWSYGYCTEALTPLNPATAYGASKDALRAALNVLCGQSEVSAAWARVFFVYGPHEPSSRLFPTVIDALLSGRTAQCTHGRQLRDYLYVEDVAEALVTLLAGDARGTFNVSSGVPIAVRDLASRLADRIGGRHMIDFGARPAAPDEAPFVVGDNTLLRSLGWAPKISVEDGIDLTLKWWHDGKS